jgi:hypothetical protein
VGFAHLINCQQICNGSLGDNIFLDGDFGSGVDPTVLDNPGIAPNYNYSNRVPRDGEYVLTKNTGNLAGLYGSWLRVADNSGTPDGYFMVVNASYSPGIFYEKTIENLCGNTTYEFSADIINLVLKNANPPHSDPNVNFLLNDEVKYGTLDIPKKEKWETFGFTFTTKIGQTSVKLTLRNNAPGGIGNDLGLDNIKFRACGPASFVGLSTDSTKFLCKNAKPFSLKAKVSNNLANHYLWQTSIDNKTWTNVTKGLTDSVIHNIFLPGNYYYRYYSAGDSISLENSKCRVLSNAVHIQVLPDIFVKYDTTCVGNPYQFGNRALTVTGYFEHNFTSSKNCDSLVQLYLTVLPDPNINANFIITDLSCFGKKDGKIAIENIVGGNAPYQIIYSNKIQNNLIENLNKGSANIILKDKFGCSDTFLNEIKEPEEFTLFNFSDTTLILGDEINLEAKGNQTIGKVSWSPSVYFRCNTCNKTEAVISKNDRLTLNAETSKGCKDSTSFNVIVNRDKTYFISNALKLNSGTNEKMVLYSYKSAIKEITTFNVYDRYGNLVHSTKNEPFIDNPSIIWNGFYRDNLANPGVYIYTIELKLIDGDSIKYNGDITVLK